MMIANNTKSFRKGLAIFMVVVLLGTFGCIEGLAAGELIFHSGFEPGTVGVISASPYPGTLRNFTGIDNTFSSHNDWVNSLNSHPNIGSLLMEYESKDTSHERYAALINDPTLMMFEDSFDDAYAIGNTPHQVANDMGKRNWTAYQATDASALIQGAPDNAANQVMRVLSTKSTINYPRLDKHLNVSSSMRMVIQYKVMNLSNNSYLGIALPTVSGAPNKDTVIRINGSTATVGSLTKTINPNTWTEVLLDVDLLNNSYSATVNGDTFAKDQVLFTTPQTDFSNVRVRFNSALYQNQYYYFDDVKILQTPIKFEDNFDLNYNIGDAPHRVSNDTGRINWSSYYTLDCSITAQADPLNAANKVMSVLSTKTTTNYPKLDKNLDLSSSQRMTIDYKVMNLSRNTYIDIDLPSVAGAPAKNSAVRISGSLATVGTTSVTIDPNAWTDVSLRCDLYNNMYDVYINGVLLAQRVALFATPQTDFRNLRIRFNSGLGQNQYYYLDNVKIINSDNRVLKYYGGKVINDSKLRVQANLAGNSGLTGVYYKYRMYLGDGFEVLKSAGQGVPSYWLTLSEFFDGTNWAVPLPTPNYCSRITMGIDTPTGAGNPLKFHVDYQTADDTGAWDYPYTWVHTSTVDVPINQWATIEVYLKQGVGTNGKFQMYMTLADGVRQTVFDISDTTYDSGFALNGFEYVYPMKFYGNKTIFNNVNAANSDMQVYWDDFEIRTDLP